MNKVVSRIPGTVIEASVTGHSIRFFVVNPADFIQSRHFGGEFYEVAELTLMSRFISEETSYLDVGANVGNHVIWLNKFIGLKNIVVIEPNPVAASILQTNILLNDMRADVDLSYIGYGLSDRDGRGTMRVYENNLGAARFTDTDSGDIELTTADRLLKDRTIDFVKIDVEGMEMECLAGMRDLIERCRPAMFIEVDNENAADFGGWSEQNEYVTVERYRRYPENENYLILPAERRQS